MPRPIYETDSDVEREEWVAQTLSERWKCNDWKRNPSKYPIDISFIRDNQVVGFAEIKCRNVARQKYDTYMISADKIVAGINLAKATNLRCLLVVCWTDAIGWIDMHKTEPDSIGYGGQLDREDSQDVEPVIYYDIDQFNNIKTPLS